MAGIQRLEDLLTGLTRVPPKARLHPTPRFQLWSISLSAFINYFFKSQMIF